MDLDYTEGAAKSCRDILCCRAKDGFPVDEAQRAGKYGTYGCDVPKITLDLMGEFINANLNPDVVFWTGDSAPHDQWQYSLEYV